MGSCQSSPAAAVATSPPQSSKAAASKKEHVVEKKQKGVGNGSAISPVGTESTAASADSPTINKQKIKETATSETTDQQQQRRDSQHNRIPSQDVSIGSSFNSSNSDDGGSSQSSSNNNNNKATNGNHHHHQLHCMKSPAASNTKSLNNGDLSTSHRRRKSRQLDHSDSRVGLHEIISGDLKNPNLVRIEVPLGKPIEEVYEGVHDGPVLGSGISGIVRLVKHKKTGVQYAVKCLDLALIDSEEGLKQLKEEIYIMCQLVSH